LEAWISKVVLLLKQTISDEHKNNKTTARDVQRRRGKMERGKSIKFVPRQFWRLKYTLVEIFSRLFSLLQDLNTCEI
jgi:hypothetical protein